MYCDVIAVGLLCLVSAITSQQPPHGAQFFYLNPNNVANLNLQRQYQPTRHWYQPVGQMRFMPETVNQVQPQQDNVGEEDEDEPEAMQFHSQDGAGSFAFGYSSPDQVRIESRSMDGSVRGSYSYLDPTGRTIKVQYWDVGTGFHSAGNHLPESVPQPVQHTPEVQAARDEHFRAYQQVLERNAAYAAYNAERRLKEQNDYDSDYTLTDQQQNLQFDESNVGVTVESDSHSPTDDMGIELTRYPKLEIPQNLFDPSQVHDPKLEAVIVENPKILGPSLYGNSVRSAKSVSQNLEGPLSETPRKGFSYSFQHPIPTYLEVKTVVDEGEQYTSNEDAYRAKLGPEADDLKSAIAKLVKNLPSLSQRATNQGKIPIAAVHDIQVAPYQRDGLKNHQIQPLHFDDVNTEFTDVDEVKRFEEEPSVVPSLKLQPPLSVSQRAAYFGAIPVAAVHDAQVSPKQWGAVRNHQVLPLYMEHGAEEN